MTPDNTRELIAEAEEWAEHALPPSPWGEKHVVHRLTAALTAAGVAPQGPQALDAEKVAEVLCQAIHSTRFQYRAMQSPCDECSKGARALCEAYTEGKLT